MLNFRYSILIIFLSTINVSAQINVRDSLINASQISFSYTYQMPSADMAIRFGNNSNLGVQFNNKFKNNLFAQFSINYLFGSAVNEPTLMQSILTKEGNVLQSNGQAAIVRVFQRGISSHIGLGYVWNKFGINKNSGILIMVGGGYLQHRIRIENLGNTAPQLSKEYIKGYDRLCGGVMINQFIGYQLLSNRKFINFYFGFEFTQAFTVNLRAYNFDLGRPETGIRRDFLNGFKFGWIIPLYGQSTDKFYYF
jgi:hypothetical protein